MGRFRGNNRTRKKKVKSELKVYFPLLFGASADLLNYNQILRSSLISRLDQIIEKDDKTENLNRLEKQMLSFCLPNQWNLHIKGNVYVEYSNTSEQFLMNVQKSTGIDASNYTLYQYYNLIESLKKEESTKKDG